MLRYWSTLPCREPFDVLCEVISSYSRQQLFHQTSAVFQFSCRGPLETTNHKTVNLWGKERDIEQWGDPELLNCNVTDVHIRTDPALFSPQLRSPLKDTGAIGFLSIRFHRHTASPGADWTISWWFVFCLGWLTSFFYTNKAVHQLGILLCSLVDINQETPHALKRLIRNTLT